jgi:hypothetical protein
LARFLREVKFFSEWQGLVNERNGACEMKRVNKRLPDKQSVVMCMERSGMHTTTPLKKNEKNETEQCKKRDRPID